MDDKFLVLYFAYIIDKLDTWRNKAYQKLDEESRSELLKIWPCNIDTLAIYTEAIKRSKPEIYSKNKSLRQMFDEAEKYLKERL